VLQKDQHSATTPLHRWVLKNRLFISFCRMLWWYRHKLLRHGILW